MERNYEVRCVLGEVASFLIKLDSDSLWTSLEVKLIYINYSIIVTALIQF